MTCTFKLILYYCVIFSKILDMCLKTFDLDSFHFYSAFGLAWIVKLKINGNQNRTSNRC